MNKFIFVIVILISNITKAQIPIVSKGTMIYHEFNNSKYFPQRAIAIWLPKNYNINIKHNVIYMHDAQALFDTAISWNHETWEVDETMQQLIDNNKINSTIIVGIYNSNWHRRSEYFPKKALLNLSKTMQDSLTKLKDKNNQFIFLGDLSADIYLKFIVEELKPFVDSSFSTHRDASHTFMAGSSMGALISLYGLCEYPNIFGGAACISTHWTGAANFVIPELSEALLLYFKQHLPNPKNHKIYFDYGSVGLDSLYKVHQNKMDEIMRLKNYNNKLWITKEFMGAAHNEKAWRSRLNIPLQFILEPQ
jgi:predicted alpha/beta superfamily hydrolase